MLTTSMHYYFKFCLPYLTAATSFKTSVLRIIAHVTFVTPYMQFMFFFGVGTLQAGALHGGIQLNKERFPTAIRYAYCFWPFVVTALYFNMVPIRYGNLLMDCCGFVWGVYLSWMANKK